MDIKDIKEIYRFLKTTDIVEFELEDTRGKVRVKRRDVSGGVEGAARPVERPQVHVEPQKEELKEERMSNIKVITAPMVGTFYRGPSPDTPPFVELGGMVKAGQVTCIIEAMKIMNEVESEYSGKIVSVLVENGQPVEYGEPIFHVEV